MTLPTLLNSTAIVTGSSKGIGAAIAKKLSSAGCNLILCSRNESLLKTTLASMPLINNSQKHQYTVCDVTNLDDLNNLSQFKDANILVNCAGLLQNSLLFRTSPQQISNLITTNLTAPIMLSQKFGKIMIRQKTQNRPKVIINITSVLARTYLNGTSVYCASKAGLVGFTKALAQELSPKGIRVNCVSPGLVGETDAERIVPVEVEMCTKEDVANEVLKLIESEITGEEVVV